VAFASRAWPRHGAGVVNRFTGLAIEGFDPVAYFTDARPLVGRRASNCPGRRHLAFPQRAHRASFVAIRRSTARNSAATTAVTSRAAWRLPVYPRFWADLRRAALSVRPRRNPRAFAASPQSSCRKRPSTGRIGGDTGAVDSETFASDDDVASPAARSLPLAGRFERSSNPGRGWGYQAHRLGVTPHRP